MSALVWDAPDARQYEQGIDRAVVYIDGQPGFVWNGLMSVVQNIVGGSKSEHYFDGKKYADIFTPSHYQATVKALSVPEQFLPCLGEIPLKPGVYFTRQPRIKFGFVYRTLVQPGEKSRIHIIWNATITRSARSHMTTSDSIEPSYLEFIVDAFAAPSNEIRPTAHVIIDQDDLVPEVWELFESILYGTDETDPYLPSQFEIISAAQLRIIDHGDGTWSATSLSPIYISMLDETTFQIDNANAEYLDEDTYEISDTL